MYNLFLYLPQSVPRRGLPGVIGILVQSFLRHDSHLTSHQLSYIGNVFARVTPDTVDHALTHLQQSVGRYTNYLSAESLEDIEDVISLLNAGALKVFVTRQQLSQLLEKNIEQDRLVLFLPGNTREQAVDAIAGTEVGVYAHQVGDVELAEAWLKEYGKDRPNVFISFQNPALEDAVQVAKLGGIPVVPAQSLKVDAEPRPGFLSVAKLLMANATSDRSDGLFTTLVTDERGIALGLVYSSEESVAKSLETGRGVYQSRKRGLWYKGESSGDIQELVSIALDCDSDCLQFVVRQKGRGRRLGIHSKMHR